MNTNFAAVRKYIIRILKSELIPKLPKCIYNTVVFYARELDNESIDLQTIMHNI